MRVTYISIFTGMTKTMFFRKQLPLSHVPKMRKGETYRKKHLFPTIPYLPSFLLLSFPFCFSGAHMHTGHTGIYVPVGIWWQTGVSTKVQSIIKNLSWILRLSTENTDNPKTNIIHLKTGLEIKKNVWSQICD